MTDYSNPLGVHTLVWAGQWDERQARTAIEQSAAAGYDVIELLLMDPRSVDVAMTRSLLDEYGMQASASLGLSAATDVSSDDDDVVKAGRRLLADAASVSVDLGVRYVGGVIFGALQKYSQPVTERGRANSVESVRTFADALEASSIPVGLEVVNRYESNMLNTGRQAVEYIAEVGSSNLYVHLDSYHMNIEEFDMAQAVHDCGERLGYVHIGESHRGYLGTGTVDFTGLFRGLQQIGYEGIVTFESFSSAVVDPGLSYTLAIWRNLWSDNLDLARHARGFIDAQLRSAAKTV